VSKTLAKRVAPSKPAAKKTPAASKAAQAAPATKAAPAKPKAAPVAAAGKAASSAAPAATRKVAEKAVAAAAEKSAKAVPARATTLPAGAGTTPEPTARVESVAAEPGGGVAAVPHSDEKIQSTIPAARPGESLPSAAVTAARRAGTPALTVVTPAMPARPAPPAMPARPATPAPFEPQRSAIKVDPKLMNVWKSKPGRELSDEELLAMPDSEYMNEKQLEFFRHKLEGQRESLLSNAGETTEHLREDTSIVPDPADRATIEEEHALELRTRDRERKLLKKISQALARIEAGEYGFCDETGEPIGLPRLIARPTATLSLEAQQRRELKQRLFGD
jgi:DnaK suppressor protein